MRGEERTAWEVLDDHVDKAMSWTLEEDLVRNYAESLVVLTTEGVYRGYGGMRFLAERLKKELPDARFHYRTRLVEGEFAFLEWTAESPRAVVEDGADSYLIRDGYIVAQSIHYTVKPRA